VSKVNRIHRSSGSPLRASNPMLAHGVGVPSDQIISELSIFQGRDSGQSDFVVVNQPLGKLTAQPSLQRSLSGKGLGDIERNSILHDVITSPAQLVGHRFDRYHAMALGFLSLIETVDPGTEPDGEVGRFDKRPG
jgi:hypothetical protein